MSGGAFESYLQQVLIARGYAVQLTGSSGDLGVDLIASREGETIAIQVKRHDQKVSRRAVSDAVAGMQHYRCNKAMVITNNYFSDGAARLARSTGCTLVDRDILAEWIRGFQTSGSGPQAVIPSRASRAPRDS
jgi:HJR/Mrr/RecB family endonuclease